MNSLYGYIYRQGQQIIVNWSTSEQKTHTSFAICCKISTIAEKSGLDVGSCCQHVSSRSASLGGVCLGMVGRKPWKQLET